MPSLPLALLAAAAAFSTALADQVLVLATSRPALFHAAAPPSSASASSAFSTAGLADLALNSLGLRTGRVATRAAAQSPLQADVFAHSQAYALLLLDDAALAAVDAAVADADAFHALYAAPRASIKVPAAVAQEFHAAQQARARCAGSVALCASLEADAPAVAADLVQRALRANSFLDAADAADVAFARELAQLAQLAAQMENGPAKALYVVGLSALAGAEHRQKQAQQAAAAAVAEFLAQLLKTHARAAAQVMTARLPRATQQAAALSRRARSRKLLSGLTDEEDDEDEQSAADADADADSDSDEDDEEETEDLAAQSGSVWDEEDDANSTATAANATARGAVSMPDIAEYQIILWTSVLLGAVLLLAVLAMGNMDTGRDSLLYAKFIADVSGRKTN
ncbi:RxLR-like protein [Phytophthora cinnamomi]|uniref:RxLR-like protein n=1 Tax=Phytophthora cinnamomi TaxID=4785 RepID=UPI0035597039|nr:RxLR-like protein [Phytophthora cinnamomi]